MKVLLVVRPAAGGIRKHVGALATHLPPRGVEVALAAPFDFMLESSAPIRRRTVPIAPRTYPLLDLLAARQVAGIARESDLLHGHGLRGAWIAALASRFGGKPFVFTAHNLIPTSPGPLVRAFLRFVVRQSSTAICVSEAIADGLRSYAAPGSRIDVIPNGIDVAAYAGPVDRAAVVRDLKLPEALLAPDAKWVVAVGRLSPEKGFDVLAEAARLVSASVSSVFFVLAGTGPQQEVLQRSVEAERMKERFVLPGYVDDVAALLRAADVVLIPSREEGQGIVALEAMAAGAAVVASDVGGLPETVGDAGLLAPAHRASGFAAACIALLGDEDRRKRLVAAGRRRVAEQYSVHTMIDRTVKVYRDVVER